MGRDGREGRRGIRAVLIAVLAAVVLVLVLAVGFRMRTFEVIGNSRYSAERIRNDLVYDLLTENSLWFSWKYRNNTEEPRAPYLAGIQAKLVTPGQVRVTVSEKILTGYVSYDSNHVFFDTNGTVLEMSDAEIEDTIHVTGITMGEPVLYQKLPVDDTALLRTMLSITKMIGETELKADSISFDENRNITVTIGTVEVNLGQDEYLEEKVSNLVTIYPQVKNQTGTLNMSAFTGRNEAITFSSAETEPVTEAPQEETAAEAAPDENLAGVGVEEGAGETAPEETAQEGQVGLDAFMVFDSSGTLRYDAHVVNGQVVDKYGNPIDGCYLNEDGNVVDAYWNVISPYTGTLAQ